MSRNLSTLRRTPGRTLAEAPWATRLGALPLTLASIALLLAAAAVALYSREQMTWTLVGPLALFTLNLGCAIYSNAVFRRQTALLLFHLALIAVALLVALGRLTYLKGQAEVTDGAVFDGQLIGFESGPWHPWRLDRVRFENQGFSIHYTAGPQREKTRNRVAWTDAQGIRQSAIIGDMDPLLREGYRFYTSPNKGFAPVFAWYPKAGAAVTGSVHLPGYPVNEYRQSREWTPPGSRQPVWIQLDFDEVILDPEKPSEFRLPSRHKLIVNSGNQWHELQPGGRLALADGTLVYKELRSWMGYNVFYDWTLPWLLAACSFGTLCLGWHFWAKFAARPWRETGSED